MGAVDIDPTSVFGVRPAELDQLQDNIVKANNSMPLQEKSISSPSFNLSHHQTPKPLQPMQLGTPSSATSLPQTSLFQTAQKPGVTPNQLQFETPNLTPIPTVQDHSFVVQPSAHGADFVDLANPGTIRRAKQVAARLYYEPTPETPNSDHRDHSRYLRGRSVLFDSSSISETPLRRGGRPSELSTSTARKPRALFMASENKQSNSDKPEDENVDFGEDQQGSPQNEEEQDKFLMGTPGLEKESAPDVEDMKEDEIMNHHKNVEQILELICLLGAGYWRLCQVCKFMYMMELVDFKTNIFSVVILIYFCPQYRCRESLQLFDALPQSQHNTGWVLNQEGRAYFEMADYKNAQRSLELMQRLEPHRMKGLDLLSTVFWQLKKDVEIAHLAQTAVDFDRLCPEAWCVVGNCFSLQKEHETALVFFGRSIQLDPSFTYTHTLSGYEYMANEDFDKAIACFRNAVRIDERHYNAWYGLGAIYHRQEKYDLAEYHFQRAVTINSQSSVLRCNLGMSQYSNGKAMQALDTLAEAFRLDPHNPQARFQRATIYVALNRPEEALKELERVRDAAPREATVHFAMGKVLKRLGRPEQAMRCFLTALDLDPKDNQLIKSAMDKLDEPDVDEEVAAF
jgi:anaphase-promoting complex subunit 3